MPGNRKFHLVDGRVVWAHGLEEAKLPHPGRVVEPWNVYLVGDGYTLRGYAADPQVEAPEQQGCLQVPNGITLFFHCPEGGVFDSNDEARIARPDDEALGPGGYLDQGPDAMPSSEVVPETNPHSVFEHVLTFPSLRTQFPIGHMVQLRPRHRRARILAALSAAGLNPEQRLSPEDVGALDDFHTGGLRASRELLALVRIRAEDRVVDIGAGLAGPVRLLASSLGCHVDCLELSPDFCAGALRYC